MDNKPKAIVYMLISALAFTIMQALIKLAGDIPVFEKVFFRNIIGLVFTYVVIRKNNISLFGKKENQKYLIARALLGVGGIVTYFYCVTYLPMADASILSKLNPFMVTLFAWLFLKEQLSKIQIPILIGTFIGALCVIKPQFNLEILPALSGLASAVFAGGAYTLLRVLKNKEHPTTVIFYFCFFTVVSMTPFMLFDYVKPTPLQLLYLIGVGIMAIIGQYGITYAYKYAPAAEISIYNYSSIIFAVILGIVIWRDIPDYLSIIGGSIIIAMAYISYRYNSSKKLEVNSTQQKS